MKFYCLLIFAFLISVSIKAQADEPKRSSIGLSVSTLDLTNSFNGSPLVITDYRLKLNGKNELYLAYGNQDFENHWVAFGLNKSLYNSSVARIYTSGGLTYTNANRFYFNEFPGMLAERRESVLGVEFKIGAEFKMKNNLSFLFEGELFRFDIYDNIWQQLQTDNLKFLKNTKIGIRYNF